jgi:transposase
MEKNYCAVHIGNGQVVKHSLALRKEKGVWVTTPVCLKCRAELIRQAKVEGRFLPFYGLEQSEVEAAKRNHESLKFRPFLEKFGKARKAKPA